MKRRILFLLLMFCSIEAFCQLPPSNVIDLGRHGSEEESLILILCKKSCVMYTI